MAILEDKMLHFKENGLASVSFDDLKSSNIDFSTRSITSEDMLANQFYLIYNGQKVSSVHFFKLSSVHFFKLSSVHFFKLNTPVFLCC